MSRTYTFKVSETEIEAKPSIYLGYLKQYGQVHFELSESSYNSLKGAWNKIKDMKESGKELTENSMETIFAEHNIHNDSAAFGILAFLVAAITRIKELSTEHCSGNRVILIVK
jgi:hypothetical protein